jgi:replicative DNA helicase
LGGFQPSDLIVLAARPAVGKTSLALNIALRIIKDATQQGSKIMMFSLEMGQEQLVRRLMSMEATVDQTRLRNGDIEDDQWERLMEAMGTLSTDRMWIDDTPAISLTEMRSRARRIQSEHGLDLILVDYMQLMKATLESNKHENRTQEVSAISRGLKELARELNVPVVALAQLSRAVESRADKTPQLSDLRESGSIEQDSDVVMFIHQDPNQEIRDNGYALNIIVAKHRNGPVGVETLWFTPHLTRFSDIEERFNAE